MQHLPRLNLVAATFAMIAFFGSVACGGGGSATAQTPTIPPTATTPTAMPTRFDVSAVTKIDPGSTLVAGWQNKGMLQVYVRGYQDSNGDGIGDIKGLISRLDYIQSLGVGGIWLMPINTSQDRDHGYAVSDYRNIEPDYGSLADVDELLKQAHARGLGVIMDYVINHSAATHPAFESSASPSSPYRDWYLWESQKPTGWSIYGSDPWRVSSGQAYFAPFSTSMPDFNLRNRAVVDWHLNNLRFWLNRGMDGFRFDAVGHLVENGPNAWDNQPQNNTLLAEVSALVGSYARRYIVCEGPGAPRMYASTDSCGSAFAFQHNGRLMAAARGDEQALADVADYPKPGPGRAPERMASFLSNHDAFAGDRVSDQLGANPGRMRVAASMLLLQPGVPFIYYGEEIGLAAAANLTGDWKLRTPMSWTNNPVNAGFSTTQPFRALSANATSNNVAAQTNDPASLLNHYKTLLKLRSTRPSITQGSYEQMSTSGSVISFKRSAGPQTTWVAINTAATATPLTLQGFAPNTRLPTIYSSTRSALQADAVGDLTVMMLPFETLVFGQ